MEPIYQADFKITERDVDCYGRLMPSMILFYAQQVAGMHSIQMTVGYETLEKRRMFWAVTRHKVQVTRLPRLGETIQVKNVASNKLVHCRVDGPGMVSVEF